MNPVALLRKSRFCLLTGLLALFAFSGDIIADAVADLRGDHCVSESSSSDPQHEKSPCSHCSCAVHNGSAVASTLAVQVSGASEETVFILRLVQAAPAGLPAAIDHPPQLS